MTMIRRLLQTTLESCRRPSRSLPAFVKHHTMSVLAVVGIVVSLLLIAGVHALSMRLYHSMALQGTQIQVRSLMALQELYADRLLTSAQQAPQVIETSMVGAEEAAPCPSTFANELGLRLAEKYPGSLARECSEHPFNSEGPSAALDAFQTEAIRYLSAHPQDDYFQFATFAEKPSLRLAMATRMNKSCVRCHNAHPDSPKRDWRVGDVAGIIEFVRPLGDSVAAVRGNLYEMLALVIPAMALSLCGVGWVIQSLRRGTAELEKSESRNRAFLNASRDCVVTADHEGRVLEFNPAAERIFGYRRADLVGKDLAEFLIPPALRERHREGMRRVLASGQGRSLGQPIETQGLRADGTEFPIELTITAVHLNGNYLFTASIHDITQRKRRQAELEETNLRLIQSSRMAGKAEMATGVLHNVGNALNSINVSVNLLNRQLKTSQVNGLSKACALMDQHAEDLGQFISQDVRGRRLPDYLKQLANQLASEKDAAIRELGSLVECVDHVKEIVAVQQSHARISGLFEPIDVARLAADAVKMNEVSLARRGIRVELDFQASPTLTTDKHKVLQILINLVSNAKHALESADRTDKLLTVRVETDGDEAAAISVADNGVGIAAENMPRVFQHGFTTRAEGHGFGLHSSALAAQELGGSLIAESSGPGCGARFVLRLPLHGKTPAAELPHADAVSSA